MNYYNEHDPKAAAWLRELIRAGEIPPGFVDERSILDLSPHDLTGYIQHHFFAGIGGWSRALRLAGWPADRPVRTGSCPCQPFSQAGEGRGFADERHLWPVFRDLITFGEATVTFGEQVASALGREWLAGIRADLEGMGYAVGAADLCAAGAGEKAEGRFVRGTPKVDPFAIDDTIDIEAWEPVVIGAPHIRQRLFWVAHPDGAIEPGQQAPHGHDPVRCGVAVRLGHTDEPGSQGRDEHRDGTDQRAAGETGVVGHACLPSTGFWSRFDLLPCTDGKARRVEPGSFPLAHGVSGRVGLLRGYGNAIVPEEAAVFIESYLEAVAP